MLVLEGWCLGVRAQPEDLLRDPINALERDEDPQGIWRSWVNNQIRMDYEPLWRHIDYWVQLQPPGFEQVVMWREPAGATNEPMLRMDALALRRFVDHYERLTRWQWESSPPAAGPARLFSERSFGSVGRRAHRRLMDPVQFRFVLFGTIGCRLERISAQPSRYLSERAETDPSINKAE